MTENSTQSQVDQTVQDIAPLNSETASVATAAEREQCTKIHALCEGQCKCSRKLKISQFRKLAITQAASLNYVISA